MDSIGDWLYIVFLIVAGISSMINAGKKKKEAQEAPEVEAMPQPEAADQQPRRPRRTKPFRQKVFARPASVPTARKSETIPTDTPFLTTEEQIPAHLAESTPAAEADEEQETIENNLFTDRDELRKAILYAEILQRKV